MSKNDWEALASDAAFDDRGETAQAFALLAVAEALHHVAWALGAQDRRESADRLAEKLDQMAGKHG